MSRILIVEDDPKTSKQLKKYITGQVDGVHADVALNVPQARRYIEDAEREDQPYDVVVLDLMLPPKRGVTAELDETLCTSIKVKMPDALVAHITAFDKDKEVKTHLELFHARQTDRSFRLAKEKHFTKELIDRLKPFLYGLRITKKLDSLFSGGVDGSPALSARLRYGPGGRSNTHELADLTREISSHWNDLDKSVQQRILKSFNVITNGNEVTVTLF